jgi:galacturonosyltransferase
MLCKPQDADSLFDAMKAFLALPHPRREAMGTAGRTHMEAVFDKEKVVQATLDALNL